MERIVLATGNKGKIREFERAFSHMNITCVPVKDIVDVPEPEETGITFMENAILKAKYYSEKTGLPCLADDSGLTVDALDGHLAYTPHAMRAFMAMMKQIIKS